MKRTARIFAITVGSAAMMAFGTPAWAVAFDFESTPTGFYAGGLSVTNAGLTLTVTAEGNPSWFVSIGTLSVATLLLNRSAIGSKTSSLQSGQFAPLRFSFSSLVNSVTFAFGDSGGDEDSPVTIMAFNAADVLLGTVLDTYPFGFTAGKSDTANFAGAKYFILSSGSVNAGNDNSIYWEVQDATPAAATGLPEPATLALFGAGLAGLGAFRRRRKTKP